MRIEERLEILERAFTALKNEAAVNLAKITELSEQEHQRMLAEQAKLDERHQTETRRRDNQIRLAIACDLLACNQALGVDQALDLAERLIAAHEARP